MAEVAPRYADRFRDHVVRAARHALDRLGPARGADPGRQAQKRALHALDYALDHPAAWAECAALLLELAPGLERLGLRNEWIPLLERGLRRAEAERDDATAAELRHQLGLLLVQLGRYDRARALLDHAIETHHARGEPALLGRALNRRAELARAVGAFEEAEELARDALALVEDPTELGFGTMMLGLLAVDRRRWSEAVIHLECSLDYWRQSGNERRIAFGLVNLGLALRPMGDLEAAAHCYIEAISRLEALNDPVHLATARMNLGNIALKRGEFDRALALYHQAETSYRPRGIRARLAQLYNNMGMALHGLERYEEAEHAYRASLAALESCGNPAQEINVLDNLAITHVARGRDGAARDVLRRAFGLTDTLDPAHAARLRRMLEETLASLGSGA